MNTNQITEKQAFELWSQIKSAPGYTGNWKSAFTAYIPFDSALASKKLYAQAVGYFQGQSAKVRVEPVYETDSNGHPIKTKKRVLVVQALGYCC